MSLFTFELNQPVKIIASGELGHIVGRAEYSNSIDTYFVRYKSADGRAVEQWWSEDALRSVDADDDQGAAE